MCRPFGGLEALHEAMVQQVERATAEEQLGLIRSLSKAYSGNDDELRQGHWLEAHFHVSNVRFLEVSPAGKVIAVLRKMVARSKEKRQAGEDIRRNGRHQ